MKKKAPWLLIKATDPLYPPSLKEVNFFPPQLYCRTGLSRKGLKKLWRKPALAVVGSRRMSLYGRRTAERVVKELVEAGWVIISGMARGIDGTAHRTALKAGGKTVAVLGSGIEVIYPRENKDIYWRLSQGKRGAVISQFPPGTAPAAENFPRRNWLIAALAQAVLVIEAARKSGSLITARLAAEQGKDVFAVPGPINSPLSAGTNWLISQGAIPFLSGEQLVR